MRTHLQKDRGMIFFRHSLLALVPVLLLPLCIYAEKVLVYDEKRGIIYVDKEEAEKKNWSNEKSEPAEPSPKKSLPGLDIPSPSVNQSTKPAIVEKSAPLPDLVPNTVDTKSAESPLRPTPVKAVERPVSVPIKTNSAVAETGITRAVSPGDLHPDRPADPAKIYFESGVEYFKASDFSNALRNFTAASEKDTTPLYVLWVARAAGALGDTVLMHERLLHIVNNLSECDIADDALFDFPRHYETTGDFARADSLYSRLTEQYPFGLSQGTGDEYLSLSRERQRTMRGEMTSALKALGIRRDDFSEAVTAFQVREKIVQSGRLDRTTVLLVRQQLADRIGRESRVQEVLAAAGKDAPWLLVPSAFFIIVLSAAFALQGRIRQIRRDIASLRSECVAMSPEES